MDKAFSIPGSLVLLVTVGRDLLTFQVAFTGLSDAEVLKQIAPPASSIDFSTVALISARNAVDDCVITVSGSGAAWS